jgi:3-hydroxyisobutyrate dehydrogenase
MMDGESPLSRIAFIGLGNMGLGMAGRLLDAGHHLSVWNRTASRAESLVLRGAQACGTPRDACQAAEAVICMVADDVASQAVWLGHDGILAAGLTANALAIECSTLSHEWVMRLAIHCGDRGLRYIDSPVTGLPEAAAAGTLTLLVGANAVDLDAGRPVLGALSERIIRFGEVGAGTAYKLIINMMGAVQIASAAEGLALAERAGLELGAVVGAIATGQAASPQVVRNTRRMAAADHERHIAFTSALRLKDIEYGLRFARELGLGSPFGVVAERLYRQLCETGHAEVNESKIIDICRVQPTAEKLP